MGPYNAQSAVSFRHRHLERWFPAVGWGRAEVSPLSCKAGRGQGR